MDLPDRTTIFYGKNGAGKTTLLESACYLATLRSFRTNQSRDLLKQNASRASMTCKTPNHSLTVELHSTAGRQLFKDGKHVRKVDDFLIDFWVVALAPEHQVLLGGSSEGRRKLLDRILFTLDPIYLDVAQRYERALRHKKALLNEGLPYAKYSDQVAPWNQELVQYGSEIRERRNRLVSELAPEISAQHIQLSRKEDHLSVIYRPSEIAMAEDLEKQIRREHQAKRALVGPHRDAIELLLRDQPTDRVASQGERSTVLLAIKLAEIQFLQTQKSTPPTVLLDDLGATLDRERREKLLSHLAEIQCQALVTTADEGVRKAAVDRGATEFVKISDDHVEGFSIARWVPA